MDAAEKTRTIDPWVRFIFWLPFKKRFTREEYYELFRLLKQETRSLRRRPTYVIGLLVTFGLTVNFVIRGFSSSPNDWESVGLGVLIAFGYTCGINSTREYLCERLLRLKQDPGEVGEN